MHIYTLSCASLPEFWKGKRRLWIEWAVMPRDYKHGQSKEY